MKQKLQDSELENEEEIESQDMDADEDDEEQFEKQLKDKKAPTKEERVTDFQEPQLIFEQDQFSIYKANRILKYDNYKQKSDSNLYLADYDWESEAYGLYYKFNSLSADAINI